MTEGEFDVSFGIVLKLQLLKPCKWIVHHFSASYESATFFWLLSCKSDLNAYRRPSCVQVRLAQEVVLLKMPYMYDPGLLFCRAAFFWIFLSHKSSAGYQITSV